MHYTPQTYEMAVAANAHTGLKKPSFKEREELLAGYKVDSVTKVEKVTAVLVKEVMASESDQNV